MGKVIVKGTEVRVTGISSTERGAVGVVTAVRQGWCGSEAVVVTQGILRSREFTVPVSDLSPA